MIMAITKLMENHMKCSYKKNTSETVKTGIRLTNCVVVGGEGIC